MRKSDNAQADDRRHRGVTVEKIPDGSNVARLKLDSVDAAHVSGRLARERIVLCKPIDGTFTVAVNETWNRSSGEALADAFALAIG